MNGRVSRSKSRMTTALRRILLRIYYSSTAIYRSPFCCGKIQMRSPKLQILVLGLPGVGKTTFCVKTFYNSCDFAALTFTTTNSESRQSILTFTQVDKRRCSLTPPTIIKYVELGGKEPLSETKVNRIYAHSHGVILLLDLTPYPCQGSSLGILSATLANPYLKGKPFLVTGSRLDRCSLPMDLNEFSRVTKLMTPMLSVYMTFDVFKAFDLQRIATEAQTPIMAMIMGRGPKKTQEKIAQIIKWYISQVLERKEELDDRIEVDLCKIAESQSEEVAGEVPLIEKLFESAKLLARAAKAAEVVQGPGSFEEFPESKPASPDGFSSGGGDSTCLTDKEEEEVKEVTEIEECWIASVPAPEEGQNETSDVSSQEDEGEWKPMGEETEELSVLMEPSWIEEVDESNFFEEEALFCKKSKSLGDLCDEPGENPLRRVSGAEDLMLLVDNEDGGGGFCDEMKVSSDPVYPYTKFEVTEVEFGPDLYSSPVGGGEPGHFQPIPQENGSSTTPRFPEA